MTFFVDANIVIYAAVPSDYRDPCLEVLDAVGSGHADGRLSTAVLEEIWHIERSGRAGVLDGLAEHAYTVFSPLLPVTDHAIRAAFDLGPSALGTNDRVHVGTCAFHEIDSILTADGDYDGIREVRRIDPLDEHARRSLLRDGG